MTEVWIDIGNSSAKLLHYDTQQDTQPSKLLLPHDAHLYTSLDDHLTHFAQKVPITRIAIAASAGKEVAQKCVDLCTRHANSVHLYSSQSEQQGVINGYQQADTLGIDRWLVLLGARAITKTAVMVIDAGTAVTCDFLDPQGTHLGGWIVPNEQLLCTSLAQLPTLAQNAIFQAHATNDYGRNTAHAIGGGAQRMLLGFLQSEWHRFCALAQTRTWHTTSCYMTGSGDIVSVFAQHNRQVRYIEQLLFIGMAQSLGLAYHQLMPDVL